MPVPDMYEYVAPNDVTAPLYAKLRAAEAEAHAVLSRVAAETLHPLHAIRSCRPAQQQDYEAISKACLHMHTAIARSCPFSQDRAAAERSCRLARMLANEALVLAEGSTTTDEPGRVMQLAHDQLMLARMQGSAAIALALPYELASFLM